MLSIRLFLLHYIDIYLYYIIYSDKIELKNKQQQQLNFEDMQIRQSVLPHTNVSYEMEIKQMFVVLLQIL